MHPLPECPDERRSRLLDAMPAIAWSASVQTFRFTYVNPAAEKLLGYPAESWLEDPNFWIEHLHPDDRHVAMFCHNETLAARDHELVYRMVAADGRSVWLRDYVNVHTVDGVPVELFGVMVDITREHEAEAASLENRENFRRMVELSPDCIGVHVDGTYVYVNQAFVQLLGAKGEAEILGRTMISFVDPAHRDALSERMERLSAGESVPYFRQKYRRIDGSALDVEVAALPLRYGSRDAVQVIARDITDRVRAEEELQVREARLQLLASGTHEAIWEWSPERNELWTNDAYRQMLGAASNSDTFFDEWLSRVHPDDRESAWVIGKHAIEGEPTTWWHEYRLRQTDGTYRVVLDRGHNVKSAAGERRVIGAMLDVTPLREAERMRTAAEAKFRWIVEKSVVAVYMISRGRLTYINDTGAKMLGYTADELMSMDLSTLLVKDDRPAQVGSRVACVRRKDGTLLHVAFYQNEIMVDGEKIVIGTSADITEGVRAQHALEASEQRYRELVEDVTDILYTLDQEGRFLSLSRSFERSTGYCVEEWIGRPFTDLFRPQPGPATMQQLDQAFGKDARVFREYDLPARAGAVVTVEVSSQPRYVDGVVAGTIGMARDVTERRNIARKLEEVKRMSSLGQVAASLAHEFNNVLMGIQPFVEVVARSAPPTSIISDALGHITRAIGRGKRASQEILRFANPKEPQLFAIDARVWFPTLLGQLVAALPSAITLSSSMEPGVGFIRGDREHLEQVLTNLVFNARDAIIGHGTIHVEVSLTGPAGAELVRIAVSDDGPGIAPEIRDRIFEPLFTTKRNGTGLGLAIARRLMVGQGGALTVENRPEGGSVFHALVPVAAASSPSMPPLACATSGVKRILLVEDDLSVGRGLELLLSSEGYEMTWVRVAADACEAARRTRPQVAIIDVNLPDGNGVDLVPLLRAEHADLPVVLSTGHVELELAGEEQRILSLMKPYELGDLLSAIGSVTAPVASVA